MLVLLAAQVHRGNALGLSTFPPQEAPSTELGVMRTCRGVIKKVSKRSVLCSKFLHGLWWILGRKHHPLFLWWEGWEQWLIWMNWKTEGFSQIFSKATGALHYRLNPHMLGQMPLPGVLSMRKWESLILVSLTGRIYHWCHFQTQQTTIYIMYYFKNRLYI